MLGNHCPQWCQVRGTSQLVRHMKELLRVRSSCCLKHCCPLLWAILLLLWCCRMDLPTDVYLSHLVNADVRSACLRRRQRVWTQARLIVVDALLPASSQPTDSVHLLTLCSVSVCRLRCHTGCGSSWTSQPDWRELFSIPYWWQLTRDDWLFRSLCSVVLLCSAAFSATDIISLRV